MEKPQHILITGASSGIGAALARHYAGPGLCLFLTARNEARLQAVAHEARQRGAQVETQVLDICDHCALQNWIVACDHKAPLDLVIACAGISNGTADGPEEAAQVQSLFNTNLIGSLNTILPAQALMIPRGRGQLVLVSSLAGFFPLGSAPAYSASKGAQRHYGLALQAALRGTGVSVHIVCPGFVRTPMTDINPFPMPFIMSAEKAACLIQKKLATGKRVIVFPGPMAFLVSFLRLFPERFLAFLSAYLPGKPAGRRGRLGGSL